VNKGLTGAIKLTMIFIVLLVSLFFIYNFIKPTTASEVLPAIWTADPNGENKTDFSPEETVYIEGENFLADTLVTISVTRPDGVIDTGYETTDPYGAFEYEYVLDGITGTYDIFSNDGINTATISFTDSSGAIWTTKNDCGDEQQDINHYNVGDHVYINGAGFNKDIKSWSIKGTPGSCDSNIVVASGNVNINDSGAFCFDAYTVQEGDCGVYQVKVDTKGDNYQVGDWCDKQTTEKKCEDSDCLWCQQCKYDVSTTKTNQWLTGSCVIPGTDCGWHCEKNYCGATCSNGLDCSCPKDKCVGNDYYDYPLNGTCKDCTTSCYCENGTSSGKPCYPSIIKNDPRCLCGNGVIDPGEECEIGNKETKQCGTDVGICEFGEKERECTQNCKWGNWSECKGGINPQPEICDGLDNDCGGHVDEGCCPSYSCLTPDELGDTQQENIKHGYGVNDDLQKLLDSYGYAINATEDQTNDQIWHIDADTVNIQIEFVGKGAADNSNVFGYYLNGNVSNFTPLFQMGNHSVYHVPVFTHGQKINITIKNVQDIGFGINSENKNQTQRYLYLTQNSLNPDSKDHAVVFDLCNNTYMIGFEDLYNLGDSDYEDLVVIVRVINCTSGSVCGDSIVNPPEECELPNTNDNPFCIQTTTECLGKKLGQRDAHGNCDSLCGCIDDPFKHSCVLGQCGAECYDNADCQNKCVSDILYYSGNCLDSCDCSWTTEDCNKDGCYAYENGCEQRDYFCVVDGCQYNFYDRNTDYNDDYQFYCSDSTIRKHRLSHDFFCDETCKDHTSWIDDQLVEDCDKKDGWYDTGKTQWSPVGECADKEQKEQEYRDYTCKDAACDYKVTNYQWVDTGNMKYKELSTPCEADGDKCTIDHCDGKGSCILKENVPVPPAQECKSFYCDPIDGKIKEDYTDFPLSTPCELDGDLCTNDHCDGTGSCVFKDNVPVPPAEKCREFYCDPADGKIYPKNYKLSTPCEADDNLCTIDHCDGAGSCTLLDNVDCSSLDDKCQEGVCNPSDGQCYPDYSKYPWSTSCEADSSKCTIDHCNGSGSCVFKENVSIPLAQQCKSFYCDPADGKIKENYTAYPLSTPCNADDKFCTIDHCDGSGSCVYWKDYDCSGFNLKEIAQCNWIPDGFTYTFDYSPGFTSVCDETLDKCTEGSQPLTHTCADANASDSGPVIPVGNGIRTCDAECDGFGIECQNKCIGDVRYFNGNCDLTGCSCSYQSEDCNKDGCYVYGNGCEQRDYYCTVDGCKYDYSGRNTDYNDSFVNYCSADTVRKHRTFHDFYCNGACSDHTSWIDDQLVQDCNLQDGWYNTSTTQWLPVGECADKEQKEQEYRDYTCVDAACDYKITKYQWIDTGKIKNKELSTPCEADGNKCTIDHCNGSGQCVKKENVDCSGLNNQCQEGVCNPSDGQCYPDYSKYPWSTSCEADSSKCTNDHCDGTGSCVFKDNVPVPPAQECKSFYCDPTDGKIKEDYTDFPLSTPCTSNDVCKINHCDGLGECVFWKDVPIPSKPIKTIGDPKTKCLEGEWCEWRITILTPITLTCEEGKIYWRYALDGEWKKLNSDGSSVTIYFPEESNHTLEAYCLNDCDESEYDIEKFKVEGTAFEIPLYKKWNLISVPFNLLNDDPEVVFKDAKDDIAAVWTYDNGVWYTWIPGKDGTLKHIKPGWGYWVLAKEDECFDIAGSLFSPITTPPSKELQNGWNLIGYYGTEWQTYELEEDNVCGYINPIYGNYVYCSLSSLIDTQRGFPRWSSLWGYDNCGNDTAYWHQLESCADEHWNDNRMYAGKGYWIEMDVKDSYAPATNCIWNEDLHCSFPTI